jgi:hypothetical protein
MIRKLSCLLVVGLSLLLRGDAYAENLYSDDERAKIVAYWNEPGRYTVSAPPEAATLGPWQVRLTTDASLWFFAYQKAIGTGKAPPTADAVANTTDKSLWETWIQSKVTYDRWAAQRAADAANAQVLGGAYKALADNAGVQHPGPIPPSLAAVAGIPPPLAAAVAPLQYTTVFADEPDSPYRFQDHVPMRPRYAYYRSSHGTVAYGKPLREMPAEELQALFEAAGFNPTEQRVMGAVSKLEGGFEAVNTYDTGYVSVGFIQFITHQDGKHSLLEVLRREKSDDPEAYLADFRRFGIDLSADGVLVVVDPATGAELTGPEAVLRVVSDKRFPAVFQRAGRRSKAFRLAQIRVARSHYWPGDDAVKVTVGGRMLEGKVSDIIKSEAGLATLFDRKVNRGNVEPLADVVARIMSDKKLRSFAELADYEREIVQALKYREDFLKDASLSQPK